MQQNFFERTRPAFRAARAMRDGESPLVSRGRADAAVAAGGHVAALPLPTSPVSDPSQHDSRRTTRSRQSKTAHPACIRCGPRHGW